MPVAREYAHPDRSGDRHDEHRQREDRPAAAHGADDKADREAEGNSEQDLAQSADVTSRSCHGSPVAVTPDAAEGLAP
jgi:hypothetical protein